MTETEQKAAFAAFLFSNPRQPLEAALKLFPADKDRGQACYISLNWPSDPEVLAEIQNLKDNGVDPNAPTKTEIVKEMWDLARDDRYSGKDRVAAARLIAELNSLIKKDTDDSIPKSMPRAPVYKIVRA